MLQFVDPICWTVLLLSGRPDLSARQERESPQAAQTSSGLFINYPELTGRVKVQTTSAECAVVLHTETSNKRFIIQLNLFQLFSVT